MKIRNGFVSNSSSTSFTCVISGDTESGWDMGLADVEMHECTNGHIFGDNYLIELPEVKLTIADERRLVKERGDDKDRLLADSLDDEKFLGFFEEWSGDYEEDEYEQRYELDPLRCPICQFKEVSRDELLPYVLYKLEMSKKELFAEMKATFNDWDEFALVVLKKGKR